MKKELPGETNTETEFVSEQYLNNDLWKWTRLIILPSVRMELGQRLGVLQIQIILLYSCSLECLYMQPLCLSRSD